MAQPPSLEALATELGTSPFALLRAFRDAYGMPPHTWLTDARVRAARRLLDGGTAPADAAVTVGFTDQPHLNRHFTRIVGVPPGAYQRERKNVQDPAARSLVPSQAWQNRQHPRRYAPDQHGTGKQGGPATEGLRRLIPPSSGTRSGSASPSDSPGSPSA
jgi:AraC-like DNA-binding protein